MTRNEENQWPTLELRDVELGPGEVVVAYVAVVRTEEIVDGELRYGLLASTNADELLRDAMLGRVDQLCWDSAAAFEEIMEDEDL
jgi:predicted nucleic acid-binding protein